MSKPLEFEQRQIWYTPKSNEIIFILKKYGEEELTYAWIGGREIFTIADQKGSINYSPERLVLIGDMHDLSDTIRRLGRETTAEE